MGKKRASSSRTTKGKAKGAAPKKIASAKVRETKVSATKIAEAKAKEPINVQKKFRELEKGHVGYFESVNNVDVESSFRCRNARVNYNLDMRSANIEEADTSKFKEVERNFLNEQFDSQEENRNKKKELADNYLNELKENWLNLQKSDINFSQLGEVGYFFHHLASEAFHLNEKNNM